MAYTVHFCLENYLLHTPREELALAKTIGNNEEWYTLTGKGATTDQQLPIALVSNVHAEQLIEKGYLELKSTHYHPLVLSGYNPTSLITDDDARKCRQSAERAGLILLDLFAE